MLFVDFPLPSHGYPAFISHEAAHCASEQDQYWAMHDTLFDRQEELAEIDVESEEDALEAIAGIAADLGLDADGFQACMDSQRFRPIVAGLSQQAQQSGVNVTPSFIVQTELPSGEIHNEYVEGYVDFESFQPYIDRALSRSLGTPVPDPTPTE